MLGEIIFYDDFERFDDVIIDDVPMYKNRAYCPEDVCSLL